MGRLVILTALFAGTALSAPTVGGGQLVTPQGPSEGQKHARAAAGAGNFLVVWEAGLGGTAKIRGARVGLTGASLDPAGITISNGAGGQFEPAVAFGHGEYFVVWSDMRSGDHAVYGSRVTIGGQVLDPAGILLSTEPTAARMADVAATPDGFVVAWAQAEPMNHGFVARARRLGTDGQPTDLAPLHLTDVQPWTFGEDWGRSIIDDVICQHVRLAVQGSTAMVMWGGTIGRQQGYFIVSAWLDLPTWTVSMPPAVAVVGAQSRIYHPAVCNFGQGFLFSWTDPQERGAEGLPLDNTGLMASDGGVSYGPLESTAQSRIVWTPAVASNGLVAFLDPGTNPNGLTLREVQADGSSPGQDVVIPGGAAWPALAMPDSGPTLLVYTTVNAATNNGMLQAYLVTP